MKLKAQATAMSQTKTRVLIVEDDERIAWATAELLEVLDCEPLIVGEGDRACGKAREFKPDIVLLDIDLPGMNGYEVARALRQMPEFSKVLIIAVTGNNEPEDKLKAYRAGMDLHLGKPIQINFFKELIGNLGKMLRRFAGEPGSGSGRATETYGGAFGTNRRPGIEILTT